jgi:hypothetical protein
MKYLSFVLSIVLSFYFLNCLQAVPSNENNQFTLKNDKITFTVIFKEAMLMQEIITSGAQQANPVVIHSDGNFAMEVLWSGWQAPGKIDNADNPVRFTKNDFLLTSTRIITMEEIDYQELILTLKGINNHLQLLITYHLPDKANYIRRKIKIIDPATETHLLQSISPMDVRIKKDQTDVIIKEGGFGQPIAIQHDRAGFICALEYPAADQKITCDKTDFHITCSQETGQIITKEGIESAWSLMLVTPDHYLKWWFYQYLDEIRISKLRPYTLYNSWYDLRSPQYPHVPEGNVMNEKNIMHIIDLIQRNMVNKYAIHLDGFVLDDGWDVYESDWKLREKTFPKGLKPISERLKKYGTDLGIWFGPSGGYSFRQKRIQWMSENQYEVIGDPHDRNRSMLCLAGKNYSKLFKKRTLDMVNNQGVSYFKWDGIQFACNDASHGHPIGIYSRRAVMQSVIDKCQAVRAANPKTYLNITSGTWLSPWWIQYANQIWMQGQDYAYSDAPSISKRDAAMTYRDYVLYDDFVKQKKWFPIANLMTHGIIKGNLQNLGGAAEPLDKFTNNALLYFARGVSMYELYISPDILNEAEWQAIAKSLKWAKDRFDILQNSFFIGGNPAKKEAYGYAHYKDNQGIIALRNPFIKQQQMNVSLEPALGLSPSAKNLIVEQVYPYHYIYPETYAAGDSIKINLNSYETAIFEIYPVENATFPLLAGAKFNILDVHEKSMQIEYYDEEKISYPNKKQIEKMVPDDSYHEKFKSGKTSHPIQYFKKGKEINFKCNIPHNAKNVQIAILVESPDGHISVPELWINDKINTGKSFKEGNKWQWFTYTIQTGEISGIIKQNHPNTSCKTSVYLLMEEKKTTHKLTLSFKSTISLPSMPPQIIQPAYVQKTYFIGEF